MEILINFFFVRTSKEVHNSELNLLLTERYLINKKVTSKKDT